MNLELKEYKMDVHDFCHALVLWIAKHAEPESAFLTPDPQHFINAKLLCDFIHEETGISKEIIGDWVNEVSELPENPDHPIYAPS